MNAQWKPWAAVAAVAAVAVAWFALAARLDADVPLRILAGVSITVGVALIFLDAGWFDRWTR